MVHGCHDKILMKEESEKEKKKLNGKNLTTIRCTQTTATHIHHQIVVHKRKTSNSKNIRSFTNTHTNSEYRSVMRLSHSPPINDVNIMYIT